MRSSLTRNSPIVTILTLELLSCALAQGDLQLLSKKLQPSIVSITSYDQKKNVLSRGTGFFTSRMGEIVTRRRVFPTGTHHAEVRTADGKVYRVIGLSSEDSTADLVRVAIEISPERAKPVIFKRKMPQINDRVVVFSDVGPEQQIVEGTVSAIEESSLGKVLRINATIGPGSNGSPVFNTDGELVGVAVFSNSEATSFIANAAESLTGIVPVVSEETANITRPKALNSPAPYYTQAARRNGVEGSVYLRVLVGEDGKVEMAKVVRGLPDGLTEEAIKAAYRLKFEPAKKEGKPVKYWIPILVEFKLGR